MSELDKFRKDYFLFAEAGFVAVNQADDDSATKLFNASKALNPDNTLADLGIGYLHFHKLELKKACQIFEAVLEKEPANELARTFLGMCLSLTPDFGEKGQQILQEVAEKSGDSEVKKSAESTLAFVDTFVKKSSGGPMQKPPGK